MCGRFVQVTPAAELARAFAAVDTIGDAYRPRYNVAPSTEVAAVIGSQERRLGLLRWGFVPSWSRDADAGPRPINARAEGAAGSRLFGPALRAQRCVVPVDGWFEWQDEDGQRQPYLLRTGSDTPSAIAAIWSNRRDPSGGPSLATVALLTTEARGAAATVHDRMPVLVTDDLLGDWLDPGGRAGVDLLALLAERSPTLAVTRVSRRVNDVRNEGPDLVVPEARPVDGAGGASGGAGR